MNDPASVGGESDATPTRPGPLARLDARLADLRRDATRRRIALALAVVVGLALGSLHWLGLVAGGALVGLTRRSFLQALAAGFGFGVLVLVVFFVVTPVASVDALATLRPLSYLTVALALLAPTWGAALRGAL